MALKFKYQNVVSRFWNSVFNNKEKYPANEAGEIMRRYMDNKSWFDRISSGWKQQPFLLKIVNITLFILAVTFVGWMLGAAMIAGLCAIAFSVTTHHLLMYHERNRSENALIFAAESIRLNANLKQTQVVLKQAAEQVHTTYVELSSNTERLHEQVVQLDVQSNLIQQKNEILIEATESIEKETAVLTGQFKALSIDLEKCHEVLTSTASKMEKIEISIHQYPELIAASQKSQKIYTEVMTFFAESRIKNSPKQDSNLDDFIDALTSDADDTDRFIAQWKNMQINNMVPVQF